MAKKMCQSCGQQLKQGQADLRGTNGDKTRCDIYCNQCYLNGKFQEPYITADEMIDRNIKLMQASNANKLAKWTYKRFYPRLVKSLKRWNTK